MRQVMMPRHLNPQNAIFGGEILSLMDQGAYVEALRQGSHKWVTVAFRGVEFLKPVLVGDVVSVYGRTTRIGRSSVTVKVLVEAYRPTLSEHIEVTTGEVVLVAVNDGGRPVVIGTSEPAKIRPNRESHDADDNTYTDDDTQGRA